MLVEIEDQDFERGNHIALCSGGKDSTVATHVSVTEGPCDIIVYLDTKTGLQKNREAVEAVADFLGVQMWTLRTGHDWESEVKESGFPGPARHSVQYRNLKEAQLSRLATMTSGRGNKSDLHLWTGVRSDESQRRMKTVGTDSTRRFTFHSPIADWSEQDCDDYMDKHDLPRNPLWSDSPLNRSSDCYCGSFGNPSEKTDLRAAGEGQHAEWISELEEEVDLDRKHEREIWGWGAFDPDERKRARAEQDDDQMLLCSDCGLNYPTDEDE